MATYGELLKRLRTEKGKTLRDVAAIWRRSTSYVSAVERDARKPPSLRRTFELLIALDALERLGPFAQASPIMVWHVPENIDVIVCALCLAEQGDMGMLTKEDLDGIGAILAESWKRFSSRRLAETAGREAPPPFCCHQQIGPSAHALGSFTSAPSSAARRRHRCR